MDKNTNPVINTTPLVRRHRPFFVGLFVIIPGVVLPLFLFYTLLKVEFLHGWCVLYAKYENSYGITTGNQVTISGMNIGHITDVSLVREGEVVVRMKVNRQYQHLIRKNTRAQLKQKNFVVGDWNVELTGGSDDNLQVADGDTLISEFPIQIDRTINQITGMVTAIEQTVQLALSGKGTVGRLLNEDSIVNILYGVGHNVEDATSQSKQVLAGTESLIKKVNDLPLLAKPIIDTIQTASNKISAALDSVNKFIATINIASNDIPPSISQLRSEIAEAETMMKTLQNSWLYRKMAGKTEDPVLNANP
ncbi:MAG: MCE family protein [Fibrobacter sp.]|nr:MCE family protein [Fibrobacter sp.]